MTLAVELAPHYSAQLAGPGLGHIEGLRDLRICHSTSFSLVQLRSDWKSLYLPEDKKSVLDASSRRDLLGRDPPPPPSVKILPLRVTEKVVAKPTGAPNPSFKCN